MCIPGDGLDGKIGGEDGVGVEKEGGEVIGCGRRRKSEGRSWT